MFWNKNKAAEAIRKAVKDVSTVHANNFGATRRATSMIPLASGESHEIAHTSSVRFHQLLVSLEGNQRTGCLRIISPRSKARSAILIYKGRVVGCLYGCKKLDYQYLQQDAHKHALADLASPGNVLDAYELPEELVLAAASLFNGDVIELDNRLATKTMFEQAIQAVGNMQFPGAVVVSTQEDEMICMVYMHKGRVIGVFSAADGWVTPTYEAAMGYLASPKAAKVMASYLADVDKNLGFSLTGLGDAANRRAFNKQQVNAVEALGAMRNMEASTYTKLKPVAYGPSKGAHNQFRKQVNSPVRSDNVFAIAP